MGKQALSYIDGHITIETTFVEIFSNISTNSATDICTYLEKEKCKKSLNIANIGKKIAINKGQLWHSYKMAYMSLYILKK